MFTLQFWKEAVERAIKSGAQAVLLALGGGEWFNLFDMDVQIGIGAFGGGALLSILTSMATGAVTSGRTASVVATKATPGVGGGEGGYSTLGLIGIIVLVVLVLIIILRWLGVV